MDLTEKTMSFILKIIKNFKTKTKEKDNICDDYIFQIDTALMDMRKLFVDTQAFIEPSCQHEWYNRYANLMVNIRIHNIKKLKRS